MKDRWGRTIEPDEDDGECTLHSEPGVLRYCRDVDCPVHGERNKHRRMSPEQRKQWKIENMKRAPGYVEPTTASDRFLTFLSKIWRHKWAIFILVGMFYMASIYLACAGALTHKLSLTDLWVFLVPIGVAGWYVFEYVLPKESK